jgi:hypothetical protein
MDLDLRSPEQQRYTVVEPVEADVNRYGAPDSDTEGPIPTRQELQLEFLTNQQSTFNKTLSDSISRQGNELKKVNEDKRVKEITNIVINPNEWNITMLLRDFEKGFNPHLEGLALLDSLLEECLKPRVTSSMTSIWGVVLGTHISHLMASHILWDVKPGVCITDFRRLSLLEYNEAHRKTGNSQIKSESTYKPPDFNNVSEADFMQSYQIWTEVLVFF